MDNWPCSCAVASEEELDILHAKGLHCEVDIITQQKKQSRVTQANTRYPAKAKFILARIDRWIN